MSAMTSNEPVPMTPADPWDDLFDLDPTVVQAARLPAAPSAECTTNGCTAEC